MRNNKNNITSSVRNITLKLENIISFSRNITSHFTEKKKIITLSLIIIMLSFTNITLSLSDTFYNSNVSALSYQGSAEIKFTFNPTLSINISTSDLVIDNLTPGTTSDSNIVNVSVATNASHGYTLSATVGDSLHNNTNLTHTNGTNAFSSIATNSSLPSLTTDNTWGYSYKLSNATNWNNYSGLSNETSKTLINTDNQLTKPIDFKIAAKASSTQPSGTYANTINFIAISKPMPKTIEDIVYMQTFGELLPTDLQSVKDSMILNQDYILKDNRDEKEYYVTKLEDGNVWMAQNLDLDLSSEKPLTSKDTDLNEANSGIYKIGYSTENDIIRWSPKNTTIKPNDLSSSTWANENNKPYSYDNGLAHLDNAISANNHGLSGNYYNWTAAVASNDSDGYKNGNADNSICPKGWRLPNSKTYEFSKLLYLYGITKDSIGTNGYVDSTSLSKMTSHPLWFVRSGYVTEGSLHQGYEGRYWSSSVGSGVSVYNLFFASHNVAPDDNFYVRFLGWNIRCIAR